jgi:pimeloyl-ACP methyl ester carboxylesterase
MRACARSFRGACGIERDVRADEEKAMSQAISKDGTVIDYEKSGRGPALILVDGAMCSRDFGPMPKLAPLLAQRFTVYVYDRRGRGRSGDTPPYSPEREVEDVAALIQEAGGRASLVGLSSGGALALEAAASGLSIEKVVAYEPPYVGASGNGGGADHLARLQALVAEGERGRAVKYFMRSMVGAPAGMVIMMQLMLPIWRKLKAVAHTLPYDAAVMSGFEVPTARLATVRVPTLVVHGAKTEARLARAAEAVAAAVPGAQHRTLPGQTHNVSPAVLAPALVAFIAGSPARR